jgi:probable DNA metabolism protein
MKISDMIYIYDGSFEGFLTCVFESFKHKEIPQDIISCKIKQQNLLSFQIETDIQKADRVFKSILKRFGQDILIFIQNAFLSCLEHKEIFILDFLKKAYKNKILIMNISDNTVLTLTKAVNSLKEEAHLFQGFVRFNLYKDFFIAQIKPKNFVLHILLPHFVQRLPKEQFMIYDQTHKMVAIYQNGAHTITEIDDFPDIESQKGDKYQDLWKTFYDTIAIKERFNPKLRSNLMPKRYWDNMTEMKKRN